jgi:uncharacterized protein YraI
MVPPAAAEAEKTPVPTTAPTATLLKAPTATPTPPKPTATPTFTLTPFQPMALVPSRVEGKVNVSGLNVRTGPGMAYPIVGGLSQGDVVEAVGKNTAGTWLQMVYPADSDGRAWIAAAYVDLTGSLAEVSRCATAVTSMSSTPTEPTCAA